MNCTEFEKNIHRYLDRELSAEEILAMEQHVHSCTACREEFGPLIDTLTAPWKVEVPAGLRSRILDTLVQPKTFSMPKKRNYWWYWSAAAAIILLVVGWLAGPFSDRSQAPPAQPKQVAAAPENPPAAINPWMLPGLVQSFAIPGLANPAVSLVQADLMKQWFKETYDAPILPVRVRYTFYIPEPANPDVEVPMMEYAIFSTIQRL
jgi:anti-sigma factor RsiW